MAVEKLLIKKPLTDGNNSSGWALEMPDTTNWDEFKTIATVEDSLHLYKHNLVIDYEQYPGYPDLVFITKHNLTTVESDYDLVNWLNNSVAAWVIDSSGKYSAILSAYVDSGTIHLHAFSPATGNIVDNQVNYNWYITHNVVEYK